MEHFSPPDTGIIVLGVQAAPRRPKTNRKRWAASGPTFWTSRECPTADLDLPAGFVAACGPNCSPRALGIDLVRVSARLALIVSFISFRLKGHAATMKIFTYLSLVTHFKSLIVGPDQKMVTKQP